MSENKDYITHEQGKGSINISVEVLATVAATAALEVDGVAGLAGGNTGKDIVDFLTVKKNASRGVKIDFDGDDLIIDLSLMLKLGAEIGPTAAKVQGAVMDSIEATTGLKVSAVNVNVSGLSLGK